MMLAACRGGCSRLLSALVMCIDAVVLSSRAAYQRLRHGLLLIINLPVILPRLNLLVGDGSNAPVEELIATSAGASPDDQDDEDNEDDRDDGCQNDCEGRRCCRHFDCSITSQT